MCVNFCDGDVIDITRHKTLRKSKETQHLFLLNILQAPYKSLASNMAYFKVSNPRSLATTISCSTKLNLRQSSRYTSVTSQSAKYHPPYLERQILKPDRAETCQSGTDDEVARHKSPYDPTQTTVEKEVSALREEYKLERDLHDPLLVSPANKEVSLILDALGAGEVHSAQLLGSFKGFTKKNHEVLLRKEPYVFRSYDKVFLKIFRR